MKSKLQVNRVDIGSTMIFHNAIGYNKVTADSEATTHLEFRDIINYYYY